MTVINARSWLRYLRSCPKYLDLSPAIQDAWQYARSADRGELGLWFPQGVPLIVLRAVDAIKVGHDAGQMYKLERAAP